MVEGNFVELPVEEDTTVATVEPNKVGRVTYQGAEMTFEQYKEVLRQKHEAERQIAYANRDAEVSRQKTLEAIAWTVLVCLLFILASSLAYFIISHGQAVK